MFKILPLCLFLFLLLFPTSIFSQDIKKADLAGSWYPGDARILQQKIEDYLKKTDIFLVSGEIFGLICPHAGIIYSGRAAACGFKAVEDKKIDTVILIGFNHRMSYEGIAVFNKDGFKTPLGTLYTDKKLAKEIISANKIFFSGIEAFKRENSIELILPFIQVALGNPKVLLLAIGEQSFGNCEILGEVLYQTLKEKNNFLIIASTDMSHYLPLPAAKKRDAFTAELITRMQPENLFFQCAGRNRMCGTGAVVSAMIASKKLGADKVHILKESTSAEASGEKERVVGYLSAVFVKDNSKKANPVRESFLRISADSGIKPSAASISFLPPTSSAIFSNGIKENGKMKKLLNDQQKEELLKLARDTITLYVNSKEILKREVDGSVLKETMGVFVTLHKGRQLRGCIGNIIGRKPLYLGVIDMAIASAAQDSRFMPVTEDELEDISIEISVLSPLKKITNAEEIILGTHGVLVKDAFRSGVYLPQVAVETGWSKDEFMNSLCTQKAGMVPDAWKNGECEIYIFAAEVFGE